MLVALGLLSCVQQGSIARILGAVFGGVIILLAELLYAAAHSTASRKYEYEHSIFVRSRVILLLYANRCEHNCEGYTRGTWYTAYSNVTRCSEFEVHRRDRSHVARPPVSQVAPLRHVRATASTSAAVEASCQQGTRGNGNHQPSSLLYELVEL